MLYSRVFLNRAGVVDACKLYSTHLDETAVILGDTGRLSRAIADIAQRDQPSVLFLLPSAIPEMIGTDIPALCRELQPDYPAMRLLPFYHGGFGVEQDRAIQETLLQLVQTLPQAVPKTPLPTFNLIGSCAELSFPQDTCWCDSSAMAEAGIPYFTEEQWTQAVQRQGLLMASGEVLAWAGRNTALQIANPDNLWRLNPYEPPFVGFRGAVHLVSLWLNETLRQQ